MPSKVASIYPQLPKPTANSPQDDARHLTDAVIRNDIKKLVHLLQNGADPNSQTPDGETALHVAAKQEHAQQLVERLLQLGADPNRAGPHHTPLHCAAIADRAENVRVMVQHGGDLYRKSADGRNALDYAQHCRSCRVLAFLREHLSYGRQDVQNQGPMLPYAVPTALHGYSQKRDETRQEGRRRQRRSRSARSAFHGRHRSYDPVTSSDSEDYTRRRSGRGEWRVTAKMWTSAEDICAAGAKHATGVPEQTTQHSRRRTLPDVTRHTPTAPEESPDVPWPEDWHHRRQSVAICTRSAGAKKEAVVASSEAFGAEMTSVIEGTYSRGRLQQLEQAFRTAFHEGGQHGNYLLLDPQITQNLPYQLQEARRPDVQLSFRVFLRAIFDIGTMASWQRPREQLRPAKSRIERGAPLSQTLCRIRSIWSRNYGVVVLQCFPFVTEAEARSRQALMVAALGPERLTSGGGGAATGSVGEWRGGEQRLLGGWWLRKAFAVLLEKGERQVFREEV